MTDMPGTIQNAAPITVLPQSLCRAFVHERAYPIIENEYRNRESPRPVLATNSRKRWRLVKRLTPAAERIGWNQKCESTQPSQESVSEWFGPKIKPQRPRRPQRI